MHEQAFLLPPAQLLQQRLADYLACRWDELLRLRTAVLQRFDDEDIHDLRVASRRLRIVAQQVEPFVGQETVGRIRRPLRRLTRNLGQLRNLDEAGRYFSTLPENPAAPLVVALSRQRHKEAKRIRLALEELPSKRLGRLIGAAISTVSAAKRVTAASIAAQLSEKNLTLYRPMYDLLQLPNLAKQATERHALRIAIKKWRYFNELLSALLADERTDLLERLKRYQGLLGDMNDREVFLDLVRCAEELAPDVRTQVEAVIIGQHRRLVHTFKRLLTESPLQYSFIGYEV